MEINKELKHIAEYQNSILPRHQKRTEEAIEIIANDAIESLKNGTFEEIDQVIKKCIIEAGDNPRGYNLCPGCTTPVDTTKENMVAFMNAAAKYGRGARKGYMPRGITEL